MQDIHSIIEIFGPQLLNSWSKMFYLALKVLRGKKERVVQCLGKLTELLNWKEKYVTL